MAVVPVTIADAHVARVQEAMGDFLQVRNAQGAQRNATLAEVEAYLAGVLKERTRVYEANKAATAAAAAVTDITAS